MRLGPKRIPILPGPIGSVALLRGKCSVAVGLVAAMMMPPADSGRCRFGSCRSRLRDLKASTAIVYFLSEVLESRAREHSG